AVTRLLDYYLHTALAADQKTPTWTTDHHRPPPGQPPRHTPEWTSQQQAAEWLETERSNLCAAADYAVRGGRTPYAFWIPAAMSDLLVIHGRWDQAAVLQRIALTAARHAGDGPGQAYALSELGVVQELTGDHRAAVASYQQALE